MHTRKGNPENSNAILKLSEEERQDLYGVLEDFFSCFHLQDMREMLWDWLVAALSTESGQYSTGYARSNLIFIYEKLGLLIEAAYGISRQRKKKWKRKHRHCHKSNNG